MCTTPRGSTPIIISNLRERKISKWGVCEKAKDLGEGVFLDSTTKFTSLIFYKKDLIFLCFQRKRGINLSKNI